MDVTDDAQGNAEVVQATERSRSRTSREGCADTPGSYTRDNGDGVKMTTTQQQSRMQTQRFSVRKCGHRVPYGRKKCPYCDPPRMPAEPLRDLIERRATR